MENHKLFQNVYLGKVLSVVRLNVVKQTSTTVLTCKVCRLTLILLTCTKWRAPASAGKWRMGFNSAFKGLIELMVFEKNVLRDGQAYGGNRTMNNLVICTLRQT
jgi:hypothetical protein